MRKIVFDIETKNFFPDVGSNNPADLDISVVCIHDSENDEYLSYTEDKLSELWPIIERADVLIGFNSDHFDVPLLNKYYPGNLTAIKSIDLMAYIKKSLGHRLSLQNVSNATLGLSKSAQGHQAAKWYKEGKIQEIIDYCIQDVRVTKGVYDYMLKNKSFKYRDATTLREAPIDTSDWENTDDSSMTHTIGF